jgi:hypothetical protein
MAMRSNLSFAVSTAFKLTTATLVFGMALTQFHSPVFMGITFLSAAYLSYTLLAAAAVGAVGLVTSLFAKNKADRELEEQQRPALSRGFFRRGKTDEEFVATAEAVGEEAKIRQEAAKAKDSAHNPQKTAVDITEMTEKERDELYQALEVMKRAKARNRSNRPADKE